LLKPDGKGKLSKRDGDRLGFPVFPLEWRNSDGEIYKGYREEGYYPEAFVNLLAFLGWNPGTEQEIFSLNELVKEFSLERVVKSGAKFNPEKAKWFNQEYLRHQSTESLIESIKPVLIGKGIFKSDIYISKVIGLVKERAYFANELWSLSDYLFIAPTTYDTNVKAKFWKEDTPSVLRGIIIMLSSFEPFTKEALEPALSAYIKENGFQMGSVMNSLRLCLVGESKGAGIADIIALIGKEETISRVERGLTGLAV